MTRSEAVVATVRERIAADPTATDAAPPAPAAAVAAGARHPGVLGGDGVTRRVVSDTSPDAAWVAGTPEGRALVHAGPLTPDQIVYAGSWPLWIDAGLVAAAGSSARGRPGNRSG